MKSGEAIQQNGIFGLFDILGFKAFCKQNNPKDCRSILEFLDFLDEDLRSQLSSIFQGNRHDAISFFSEYRWLIFSDTIFIALPFQKNPEEVTNQTKLFMFVAICAILNRQMFQIGFPLRGVIHTGDFIVTKKCFAGKAIIVAFERMESLEIAASVFTDDASKYLIENASAFERMAKSMFLGLMMEFPVPSKDNRIENLKTLNWLNVRFPNMEDPTSQNTNEFVLKQFQAHGKQINNSVLPKLENTQKLIVHWLSQRIESAKKYSEIGNYEIFAAKFTEAGRAFAGPHRNVIYAAAKK